MKLHIEWGRPIPLRPSRDGISYNVDLLKVSDYPGVYIFGRRHGDTFEALYVGKSMNMRRRVKGHLNSLRLMQHIRTAKARGSAVMSSNQRVAIQNDSSLRSCT